MHDFSSLPAGGLQYSVFLPVDFAHHQQPCDDGPKTAKVRAVLSWDVPPSSTNPDASVTWGNSEETTILIPAGVSTDGIVPFRSRVGVLPSRRSTAMASFRMLTLSKQAPTSIMLHSEAGLPLAASFPTRLRA